MIEQIQNNAPVPGLKTDEQGRVYREIRCENCRSWLADEYVYSGRLLLKCFRCDNVVKITFKHLKGKE